MSATAKVIEDSLCERTGCRLTTFQLRYPRFIHAEAKTHRVLSNSAEEYIVLTQDAGFMSDTMLSRNASSSRAIPVAKMIEQVRNDPAMPVHWGANQTGMQAREELDFPKQKMAQGLWQLAARDAADTAERMMNLGLHKQVANRILEPFQFINVIVSATEWANFYALRDHEDADPNIQALARAMRAAHNASTPRPIGVNPLKAHSWHLPYVTDNERLAYWDNPAFLAKLSTARCARVSYLTHEGRVPNEAQDLGLFERLVGSVPLHASPTEHPAYGLSEATPCKNFVGFHQFRADVEAQFH
jgi:thymidylate synthase ThyX